MALTPTYYLADFMTGDLCGEALPLENVQLSSSLQPGRFSAQLDMRKLGDLGDGHRVMNLLRNGKCTLVPVLEGISTGVGNPPTTRELGEWWVSVVADAPPSPIVQISGPEFAGYAKEVLLAGSWVRTWVGVLDPVVTARDMLAALYSTSQDVAVNLQSWSSDTGAMVEVNAPPRSDDYWSAISELQEAEGGEFEWMIRSGLVQVGGAPRRVTRTLVVGQPVLAASRLDVTLELAAPGDGPASVTGFSREASEHRTGSTMYGHGAGRGADQIVTYISRGKVPGEPAKNRLITDPTALSMPVLRRRVQQALNNLTPEQVVWPATMPTDRYTPRVGELYSWRSDAQWTRPAESGQVRCVGWSWSSTGADEYVLDLVEA